jgi:hypothetical protein
MFSAFLFNVKSLFEDLGCTYKIKKLHETGDTTHMVRAEAYAGSSVLLSRCSLKASNALMRLGKTYII